MKKPLLITAALDLALILPATLFMAALIIRNLPLHEMAESAQRIVTWYSGRVWTLWVLLLWMPLIVLITGCVELFRGRMEMPNAARQPVATIRAQPVTLFIALLALSAA